MSTWRQWWTGRDYRSTWREFLSDPEYRPKIAALVVSSVIAELSTALPALAVTVVVRVVASYGTHTPGVDFLIWVVSTVLGIVVYFRIARWHDRQDRIERERSRQDN